MSKAKIRDGSSPARLDVEALLEHAELALQNGDPRTAVELCEQVLSVEPRNARALYDLGEAHRDQGELVQALDALRRCVLADHHYASAWAGIGVLSQFLQQWEEARRALNRALREDPGEAEAWYARAVLRERFDDFDGSDRDMARAARLDPEEFPYPPSLSDELLEKVVERAIQQLHPTLREYLANVAILIDEYPSDEVLSQYDPPIFPGDILGYFSGTSLRERSLEDPWSQLPSAIVLFRRNLQRAARTEDELVEEVRITLLHEVGHFLGLDEDELGERGLD